MILSAVAFVGPNHHVAKDTRLQDNNNNNFRVVVSHRTAFLSILNTKGSGSDDANYNDDNEEEEIDLSEQDWRAFRAKLVMGESSPSSTQAAKKAAKPSSSSSSSSVTSSSSPQEASTASAKTAVDDGDLDGIGALFSSSSAVQDEMSTDTTSSSPFSGMTPLDASQWAYDSGSVIEKGAVILGGVEQEYGFGLRQQYFHKAAILVLDHDEGTFTKGIILNRPTDLTLDDDVNQGVKWRVWFGGDVQGFGQFNQDIVCLHSLKNPKAINASVPVMKDIQWTTFENAKKLVKVGAAKPTDFWVFCGYAGWGPGQLMGELKRKSWYMVATDSQTLLKELARQSAGADPREAGLDTWTLLMNMIGRGETAEEYSGDFDDLMLKEWALKNLLSTDAGGGAGSKRRAPEGVASTQELLRRNPVDRLLNRVSAASRGEDVTEGTLVRASSADRSPFLLNNQELHKSVVLMIAEDEKVSVGAILNRPAARGLDIQVTEKGSTKSVTLPLRYGGQFAIREAEPLLWLHCNPILRAAKIGVPVGAPQQDGIWKCTAEDVTTAVGQGLGKPEDFLTVTGVSIWTKGEKGLARGMQGEVRSGNFEIVPASQTKEVWNSLTKQEVLSTGNLMQSLRLSNEAWEKGAASRNGKESTKKQNGKKNGGHAPIGGIGDGFDEEDDSLVFKSDVKVSKLSDDALQSWLATFLLGAPTLGA